MPPPSKPGAGAAAVKPLAAVEPLTPASPLAGQAGLPPYLRGSADMLANRQGIVGGEARTQDTDFVNKDFVFDVRLKLNYGGREGEEVVVGIGKNEREGNWVTDSVAVRLTAANREVNYDLTTANRSVKGFPHVESAPDYLVRLEKKGAALTFTLAAGNDGKFKAVAVQEVRDFQKAAAFLTDQNAALFVTSGSGSRGDDHPGATVASVALSVDGKPLDKPLDVPARPGAGADIDRLPMVSLAGQSGLPAWLRCDAHCLADEEGLAGGEVHTLDKGLLEKDFVFDLLFKYRDEADHARFYAGLGENGRESNNVTNSIFAYVDGPRGRVPCALDFSMGHGRRALGFLGSSVGPHLLRLDKRGNALTMSFCADYAGKFNPTLSRTVLDLKRAAPFVTNRNSRLFFDFERDIAGQVWFQAVRLIVNGKPAGGGASVAGTAPAKGPAAIPLPAETVGRENLIRMSGPKLPAFFQPVIDKGMEFVGGGLALNEKSIRTIAADFVTKDFTFDVLHHFDLNHAGHYGGGGTLVVGIGENGRNGGWILKSVCSRLTGPAGGSNVTANVSDQPNAQTVETQMAKLGKDPEPRLFRLQKRGNTLTLAVYEASDKGFTRVLSKTFPDLKGIAPFLTATTSPLFLSDEGVVDAVRLTVEGQATESTDLALDVPARAVEGQALRRRITPAAAAAGKRFALESAPKGLILSPDGELAWTPGRDQVGTHELRVRITDKGRTTVQSARIEVVSGDDAKAAGGDLSKVDALYRLTLAGASHRLAPGLGGTSLLLLEGDQLRRLDADGLTVRQTIKLPKPYGWVAEREAYYVALSAEGKSLDLIDKPTSKVTRSVPMDYLRLNDLCPHPTSAVSFVAVEKASDGHQPAKALLIVDEGTGEVREPENFVGAWIKASPDGRRLYSAYRDFYHKGDRLLFNPNSVDVVPEYGNIDLLIVYDLTGPSPRPLAVKKGAGANGQGLALSADGKRVSYLSYVGYPLYSNNIAAWDPADLTKRPVPYPAKDNKADCKHLAFHPALPIAAAPLAEGAGAVCFQRETGAVQGDRFDFPATPDNAKVKDLTFSPDGRNLILDCEAGPDHFLCRVRVKLSPAEIEQMKSTPTAVPAPKDPGPPKNTLKAESRPAPRPASS